MGHLYHGELLVITRLGKTIGWKHQVNRWILSIYQQSKSRSTWVTELRLPPRPRETAWLDVWLQVCKFLETWPETWEISRAIFKFGWNWKLFGSLVESLCFFGGSTLCWVVNSPKKIIAQRNLRGQLKGEYTRAHLHHLPIDPNRILNDRGAGLSKHWICLGPSLSRLQKWSVSLMEKMSDNLYRDPLCTSKAMRGEREKTHPKKSGSHCLSTEMDH